MKHRISSHKFSRHVLSGLLACSIITALLAPPLVNAQDQNDPGAEAALALQNAFTSVAERASKSVVVITNLQMRRASSYYNQLPPEFRHFFGLPQDGPYQDQRRRGNPEPEAVGRGSGVIIDQRGFLVTNYHVIQDHDELEVKLLDERIFRTDDKENNVEVVGVDEDTDLAVLRLTSNEDDIPFQPLEFADSDKVKVGQWAIGVGAPFNLEYSITVGVVSQKQRYNMHLNKYEDYIQTDASINPGNSGGPLLDLSGNIIGINDFIITGGGGRGARGSVGIGFAISSNLARSVVDDIIESGEVIRPWLGISMQMLSPELQKQFGVEQGVIVADVMQGNPADEAGIQAGDVILKVGDEAVKNPSDVQRAVIGYEPGEIIKIELKRGDKIKTIEVKAGRQSDQDGIASKADLLDKLGLGLTTKGDRVVVDRILRGGPADAAGLQAGDVILQVNRQAVKTPSDVAQVLKDSRRKIAVFYIDRGGRRSFVPMRIKAE